jgi:DNA-binding XRE family transcriptional regulator
MYNKLYTSFITILSKEVKTFCKNLYTLYIKEYRILRHLTQEQLALKVGVSQGFIAQLESPNITRKKSPRLSLMLKIAETLQVCPNVLVHLHCHVCSMAETCSKIQYSEKDDEDFFDDNLIYYL